MKKLNDLTLVFIVFVFTVSCHYPKSKVPLKDTTSIDTSFLADRNFIYKDLRNTSSVHFIRRNGRGSTPEYDFFIDSTFKRAYTQFSGNDRRFLIAPFLPKDYGVKYANDLMQGYFVSKQSKIGNLQPIIVLILGNDYSALTLIVLDKNYKAVSELILETDNITADEGRCSQTSRSYSSLNNGEVTSYHISETRCADSTKNSVTIDSSVFKSLINKNGTISTSRIGKYKYVRTSELSNLHQKR